MNKAIFPFARRMPVLLLAVLAATAAACGTSNTTQTAGDVAVTDSSTDAITGTDATGTDATGTDAVDTSDVQGMDAIQDTGPEVTPQCTQGTDCNDNDPCTDNICTDGVCSNPQNGAPCDDGDPCTQNDFCKKGTCAGTGTCTDTVSDTGPDSSVDASGDVTGDTGSATTCTAAEWNSTLSIQFVTDLGACASTCAPIQNLQPPTSACVSPCIATKYNLSDPCSSCFGDLTVCAVTNCQSECVALIPGSGGSPTDPACLNCTAVNCGATLSQCTGFQAPNCGADSDCNDNSVCTTDTCVNMFCTYTAVVCDDGNACTADSCDKTKGCQSVALANTVTCNDGDACTEGDNCGTGSCVGHAKVCNDNNPCTDDSCAVSGDCTTTDNAVSCDDGVTCTTGDACVGGACTGTTNNASCDDGNPCSADVCDATGGCLHTATTGPCDDGNFCTVNDTCAAMACSGSAGTPCNDSNVCTSDTCSPTAGNTAALACSHTDISGAKCDDGNSCTSDSCDPVSGCINNKLSNTPCDDGNPATIGDTCTAGTCAGVVPECLDVTQCDDGATCTTDSCDGTTHTCKHVTKGGTCLIDGVCYNDGKNDPANSCLACTAATSNNGWSNANESFSCGTAGICATGKCFDPWPPTAPLANGKVCSLPTCDATAKLPFFSGGNWTVSTKTVATTCNALIQLVEPQANVGYVKTGSAHPMNFVGGCDYASGGTVSQIGSIVSNVEVGCDVKVDASYGVTYVETSTITYASGKGIGTGTAMLYDLPSLAGEPNNSCEIDVQVTVQHVPDCAINGDCDDAIACTTDTCDAASGICSHTLAANTCLIGGACIADGAFEGTTGNASCRYCAGKFPSQYGWIIESSGESCNGAIDAPIQYTCGLAGVCTATAN